MSAPAPIPEITGLSPARFRDEVVPGYVPVVLRGLVRDWPAVAAGTPRATADYLLGFDRGAAVEIFVGPPEIGGRFFYKPDLTGFNFERRQGRFSDLLPHLLTLVDQPNAPALYAGSVETPRMLPGFAEANAMPLIEGLGAVPRIWVGNRSTVSTHFDISDNIACVTAGRRRFTLFPPEQLANLYVGPLDYTMAGQPASMVELHAPDFDRYPRFREALAAAQSAELEPGDAIYIPALWWHQVDALSAFNVLVNYWWTDSPDAQARFEAMVYAMFAIRHQSAPRRAAWRAMFDQFVFARNGDPGAHLPADKQGLLGPPTPKLRSYIKQFLMRGLQRP